MARAGVGMPCVSVVGESIYQALIGLATRLPPPRTGVRPRFTVSDLVVGEEHAGEVWPPADLSERVGIGWGGQAIVDPGGHGVVSVVVCNGRSIIVRSSPD